MWCEMARASGLQSGIGVRPEMRGCPFSPYIIGSDAGKCMCGGDNDEYDAEYTCCGSLCCNSKDECLRNQRRHK